jgi:hypothetical protein
MMMLEVTKELSNYSIITITITTTTPLVIRLIITRCLLLLKFDHRRDSALRDGSKSPQSR